MLKTRNDQIRQAIAWFSERFPESATQGDAQKKQAYLEAVDALEKQIPMSPGPDELGVTGARITPCGNCGEEVRAFWDYCPWGGQRIRST